MKDWLLEYMIETKFDYIYIYIYIYIIKRYNYCKSCMAKRLKLLLIMSEDLQ